MVSANGSGKTEGDAETESKVVAVVEAAYQRHLTAIRSTAKRAVESAASKHTESTRKEGGFSTTSVSVLEAAFSRCPVLSQRECSIVAKAAGITHQQVRTWFQNKRNRKRGGARNTSISATKAEEEFIPPSKRIISSLPKRGRLPSIPPEPTRPVRGLPKRGKIPSPSPSTSSVSTVDSIAPAGGFQSMFNGNTGAPTISFDGSSLFEPSTLTYPLVGLEQSLMPMNGDVQYGTLPIYEGIDFDGMFNPEEFGNMLQEALADPTLTVSPTFTTSTSFTSPQVVPDDATKEAIDNMSGEELFKMLEDLLSKSTHSTTISSDGSEALASGELAAMESWSDAMTPLDLSVLSFPSSSSTSPPAQVGPGPSNHTYHNISPIDVEPMLYPSLDIYPATPRAATKVHPSQTAYNAQTIPTMQPQPGAWIPGALPFDGGDSHCHGMWMMDGQGYTHAPRVGAQPVVARG